MDPSSRTGFIERLSSLLMREPEDREQLLQLLHKAFERHLMDADALSIIEGALSVADMPVRDVMVPRAQMDVVQIDDPLEKIIDLVVETAHSRFPVISEGKDNVIGISLIKHWPCATPCGPPYLFLNPNALTSCCASFVPRAITWQWSLMNTVALQVL